jgi:hypothetical protein
MCIAPTTHAALTGSGIYQNGTSYLDTNQRLDWNDTPTDVQGVFGFGLRNATPVTVDWSGDGKSMIGVYNNGTWYLDAYSNWQWYGRWRRCAGVTVIHRERLAA